MLLIYREENFIFQIVKENKKQEPVNFLQIIKKSIDLKQTFTREKTIKGFKENDTHLPKLN